MRGETALVEGEVLHRVLVGPLKQSDIEVTGLKLMEMGFENTWLVNIESDDEIYGMADFVEAPMHEPDNSLVIEQAIDLPKNSNPSGFNLARLPKENPVFIP